MRVSLAVLVFACAFTTAWTLTPGWAVDVAQVKLTASDAQENDFFGRSVAVSNDGTTLVVGASHEDDGPGDPLNDAGAAYVYRLLPPGSETWTQVAKLRADDAGSYDRFGYSVAVSSDGSTVAVGANRENGGPGNPLTHAGAVYMFREPTPDNGTWTQVAKLTADDAQESDWFGSSVAASSDGSIVVVGAYAEDGGPGDPLSNAGAVYVFRESTSGSGTWTQVAKLTADDAQADDYFGASVAISGNGSILVVGAYSEDGGPGDPVSSVGAAYVFRGGPIWTQEAKLTSNDSHPYTYFGSSVAISSDGTTIVVGAHYSETDVPDSGATFVFREPTLGNGTWVQVDRLTADDAQAADEFGYGVAVSSNGTTIVVGAQKERGGPGDPLTQAGAAYVYRLLTPGDDTWTQIVKLTADDAQDGDWFGTRVAMSSDGSTAAVATFYEDGGPGDPLTDAGAVYLFSVDAFPVPCPPGHRQNGQECEPVNCEDGEHFNDNDLTCEPCPALTTSEAGVNNECYTSGCTIAVIFLSSSLAVLGAAAFVIRRRRRLVNTAPTDDGVDKPST